MTTEQSRREGQRHRPSSVSACALQRRREIVVARSEATCGTVNAHVPGCLLLERSFFLPSQISVGRAACHSDRLRRGLPTGWTAYKLTLDRRTSQSAAPEGGHGHSDRPGRGAEIKPERPVWNRWTHSSYKLQAQTTQFACVDASVNEPRYVHAAIGSVLHESPGPGTGEEDCPWCEWLFRVLSFIIRSNVHIHVVCPRLSITNCGVRRSHRPALVGVVREALR